MTIFSPDHKMLRSMGFISDQEGILRRYLHEREGWDMHIRHTHNFILNFAERNPGQILAVLGSGWLLDLPLEKLLSRFKTILLLDLVHPSQIREKVRSLSNVKMLECDISGGSVRFTWDTFRKKKLFSPGDMQLRIPEIIPEPDCFISLNILNQLDIIPADFIADKLNPAEEDLRLFRQKIQQFHIDWISTKPGCLISDVREVNTGKEGQEISRDLLYTALPSATRTGSWDWQFDTQGAYRKGMNTTMEVIALEWSAINRN